MYSLYNTNLDALFLLARTLRLHKSPVTWLLVGQLPDSKVHGTNMEPIWGRQDPDGPHVGPMNFAICASTVSQHGINKKKTAHYWCSVVGLHDYLWDPHTRGQ